jgi:hypothetical protein
MYRKLYELVGDAQAMTDQIRRLIEEANDYELLRVFKKLDAELMDFRHNLEVALRLCRKDDPSETHD